MIFLGIAVVVGAAAASEALLRADEYDQAAYQGRGRNRRTVLPCQRAGTLEVEVLEGPHGHTVDLADALVDVVELGTYAYSLGNGRPVIFSLTPGTYTIRARKDWYAPDAGATQAAVQVDNGRTTRITLRLESMQFHLHVDADRDGTVDASRTGIGSWVWGNGNKGAVILCNNDDDGAPHAGAPDNAANDTDVNTAADVTDIAPLDLRREGRGTAALPHGWSMRLAVSGANQNNIRVFDLRTGAGTEVIGPNTVADYQVPNGAVNGQARLEMGMEALRYAGTGFTGEIELTMTMSKPATGYSAYFRTNTTYSEKAKVRVAPWMVFHHRDTAAMVYVADRGGQNAAFRNDLQAMANAAGLPNPVESPNDNQDQWMQDCMEIGYSRLPGQAFVHSVLKMPPDKGLHIYPPTLLGPAVGYHTVGQGNSQSRFDAGGNLEATPPVKEPDGTFFNGKEFPFGRIYYCSGRSTVGTANAAFRLTMDADLEAFLKAQVVQSPIDLDSSWLTVGHVDELISFVPAADANAFKRYALLIASPRRAFQILRHLDQNGNHNDIILNGRTAAPLTVRDFLNNGLQHVVTGQQLAQATTFCQTKLDAMLRELRKKIDIPRVIEVPVIFMENRHLPGLYEALTGDMVNMLVVGTTCIVPVANGPGPTAVHAQTGGNYNMDQFEAYLQQQLAAINLTTEFIDGWDYYHVSHGEVHCGTNVRRTPHAPPNWWEFAP